ncbi:MAG: alanine:cation symporter family protein [Desulfobacteraceae bacterium]|nr:alanine:cation symporter family protein [Desulfobacteraceae bacterium]
MTEVVNFLNDIIWSKPLVYLCLGVGLYFSVISRFLQVRHIKEMVKLLFSRETSDQGISSFQALAVSVSGRVGTGNIAGVATAIALGGPGAVFWMWTIAFLGAGSAYVESVLAQIYKVEQDGEYRGGPAYYIEKGLGMKWYAVLFAVSTIIGLGFFLPGVQSNSIAAGLKNAFGISSTMTGVGVVIFLGLIIFGGVRRISKFAEIVVPFMALAYVLVAVLIIGMNISELPRVIALIFKSAFAFEPAFAGMLGLAIAWGVKRGIYSNEAGQGTGPQAAAAAEVSHPVKQGLVQAFSVYIDTLFICSATAFMILITGMYNVEHPVSGFIVENMKGIPIGPEYTQAAVEAVLPGFGNAFVAISLLFFAFTTVLAYYYIAETNVAYLTQNGKNKWLIPALRVLIMGATFYGAIKPAKLAWAMGDVGVGLMAWLNIIAIIFLHRVAMKALKDYEVQKAKGLDPVFNPKKLGIKNADFWEKKIEKEKIKL